MVTFNELVSGFKELGLAIGDVVLVHSSFNSFGGVEGGPQTVVNAIISVLGEDVTLIVRTFNFEDFDADFTVLKQSGKPFDVATTPSAMGVITELVRLHPKSWRILHPIHSFSVLGKLSDELGTLRYQSSFGRGSLFGKLVELDGKVLILGLPFNKCMTFFHHVEEMEGCDYRHLREFVALVKDEYGREYHDTFSMLTRDPGVINEVAPMGEVLEREGVVRITKIGDAMVRFMRAREVYRITAREMKKNPFLLHQVAKK